MDVKSQPDAVSTTDVAITSQPHSLSQNGDVTVRMMTREDAEFAGRLNAEAFRGKVEYAVGKDR